MDTCGVCLDQCAVPCLVVHTDHDASMHAHASPPVAACRQTYCEECLLRVRRDSGLCPTCRGPIVNYMVLMWKLIDADSAGVPFACPHCDWTGSRLRYYVQHGRTHYAA